MNVSSDSEQREEVLKVRMLAHVRSPAAPNIAFVFLFCLSSSMHNLEEDWLAGTQWYVLSSVRSGESRMLICGTYSTIIFTIKAIWAAFPSLRSSKSLRLCFLAVDLLVKVVRSARCCHEFIQSLSWDLAESTRIVCSFTICAVRLQLPFGHPFLSYAGLWMSSIK